MDTGQLVAGLLLISGFAIFGLAVMLPERGGISRRVWSAPHLEAHKNPPVWRWANGLFAVSGSLTTSGIILLAIRLTQAGSEALGPISALLFVTSFALWLIYSVYRATVVLLAAQQLDDGGQVPPRYVPLSVWADGLGWAHLLAGYVAMAVLGGAILQTSILPSWTGWVALVLGLALVAALILRRPVIPDQEGSIAEIPAWIQLVPLIVGVVLVVEAF